MAISFWLLLTPIEGNTMDPLNLSPIQLKKMFNTAVLRAIQETSGEAFGGAEARQHTSLTASKKTDEHSHTHEHLSKHMHKHDEDHKHLEEHKHSAVHKHMHVHDHYHDHNHHHKHDADHEAEEDHKHAAVHKHKYATAI